MSDTCARCTHPASWHRLDDATDQDPTDPASRFRCIGYDCDAPGAVPPGGRGCDCPDYVEAARSRGAIRCLACGVQYDTPPDGWDCPRCGGPVSQHAGTIHVRPPTGEGEGAANG